MRKYIKLGSIFTFVVLVSAVMVYLNSRIRINKITLAPSENPSMAIQLSVGLSKESPVFIEYWLKGSNKIFQVESTLSKKKHHLKLNFLIPDTTYEYRVVADRIINRESIVHTFTTIEPPDWLKFNWIRRNEPHKAKALAAGLVMVCNYNLSGSIMMVDGKGRVRWYWQADSLGVKLANITPQGTLIALLGKPNKVVGKNIPEKMKERILTSKYPLRNGWVGFTGGFVIVEIGLNGEVLRRFDFKHRKDPLVFHHDVRVDEQGNIHAIVRDPLSYSMQGLYEEELDTLWGDGVVEINKQGNVVNFWSAWQDWDIENDPKLPKFAYDRFHFNSLFLLEKGNYLVSSPIENQIWKVNPKSGEVIWKFGSNGDFKMDKENYFAFQHDVHINSGGHLMIFDNGDFAPLDTLKDNKRSRTLVFELDTTDWTAKKKLEVNLPKSKYTSRMGAAELLPNGNILTTSSKTASVVVTNRKGNILWELSMPFVPYRAEYIPYLLWSQ